MSDVTAGVGYSGERDSFEAGRTAAREALERASGARGSLALGFATTGHDLSACEAGIRSVLGDIPLAGGAAAGAFSAASPLVGECQAAVALIPEGLGCHVAAAGENGELGLMFYDSRPSLPSGRLAKAFRAGPGGNPALVAGARLSAGFDRSGGAARALVLAGDFEAYATVTSGFRPLTDYLDLTRVEGARVLEISGRPALEVLREIIGGQAWRPDSPLKTISLGANLGERYAPYLDSKYVNRLIAGHDPEEKSILLAEEDFAAGDEIRFMRRDEELLLAGAEKVCRDARGYLAQNGLEPFFALYIDSACRRAGFCGASREEAEVVQRAVGRDIPLLGLYAGLAIAPIEGQSRATEWAGVLVLLGRKK